MSKQLVVYISATGTTRRVAQNLAKAIDADLAEIVPVPPFTAQDIDWTDPTSRASRQHADRAMRPPISASPSADGYDEIFVTSSSSTRGALGEQLHDSAPDAHWVNGRRFAANASEAELKTWADSIA